MADNPTLQDGMTPLHLAARHGHMEVLDVLKDHLELTTSSSKTGFTALHVAAHFGQTNTVRELLNKLSAAVTSVMARDGAGGGEVSKLRNWSYHFSLKEEIILGAVYPKNNEMNRHSSHCTKCIILMD